MASGTTHNVRATLVTCTILAATAATCLIIPFPQMQSSLGVVSSTTRPPYSPSTVNTITKFAQLQAVFLEATLVMLLFWLGFCFLRFFPLRRRSPWFKIRWWVSRLDISLATRHWLHDQSPVVKRKTELGGAFSIASWILFVGLFAALLYQIISKTSVEVHNVRATNAPDLASFLNDLEFNITTLSSMSCTHLRGLGTLVTGNPASVDNRVVPLSTFANYSCLNTTMGPTITLQCSNCRLFRDFAYVSWQFVDLPNNPATAIGFQFNITAKNHADKKRLSFVSGLLTNARNLDDKPVTYRGTLSNILKFNLLPKIYHNLHDLKLIQPLFHEFLPGSYFSEVNQLQASIQNSTDGLINTTLSVNFLSSYVVEIDNQNVLGPVSFLADLGGLYCISIGIFFYLLVQLRKYMRYTWASSLVDDNYKSEAKEACCASVMMKSLHRRAPSPKQRLANKMDATSFSIKKAGPEHVGAQEIKSCLTEPAQLEKKSLSPNNKPKDLHEGNVKHQKDEPRPHSHIGDRCQNHEFPPLLQLVLATNSV